MKMKQLFFGLALLLIATPSFARVSINVGLVLGAYHNDPVVRTVYVEHRSPYQGVVGDVEFVDEEPTILPYDVEDGCTEYCDSSYIVVDHVLIGGVIYPYTSVVVLNKRGSKVIKVHAINDVVVANRWNQKVIAVHPHREKVVVRRGFFRPHVRERNVYVVHRRR